MKNYVLLVVAAVLLVSCGTARKTDKSIERQQPSEMPADTLNVNDTLPRHTPPVVVPHTWREA